MKTEQLTTGLNSNIEVGSTVVSETDNSQMYKVVFITVANKAILVSKTSSDITTIIDLMCVNDKVLSFRFNEIAPESPELTGLLIGLCVI
jgi:hypothetical protein